MLGLGLEPEIGGPAGLRRDAEQGGAAYRGRNVIERAFNGFKHWRGLATRYDKDAIAAASSSQPCCSGSTDSEDTS